MPTEQAELLHILSHTVFNLYGIERLAKWKSIRDSIETASDPLAVCVDAWAHAPFVSAYLDPLDAGSWPDPWQLIIDSKYDCLAISLGMLYTLNLTSRFTNEDFKIYMTPEFDKNRKEFYLLVANTHVLNLEYSSVSTLEKLNERKTTKIFELSKSQ